MSYKEIDRARESLIVVLRDTLKLDTPDLWRISEAIEELAEALADQQIDRLFNRGDFR